MRVLILDDDEYKINQIKKVITDTVQASIITEKRSYISGLSEIMASSFDVILLDMTMPNYDMTDALSAGDTRLYAGENILDEMKREGIQTPALVITQYSVFGKGKEQTTLEELTYRLEISYPDLYKGTISFSASENKWKEQLSKFLESFKEMPDA